MAVTWYNINKMTSNTSLSPIVAIGSGTNVTDYSRIFNGTYSHTTGGNIYFLNDSGYVGVDFGEVKQISNIKIIKRHPYLSGNKYTEEFLIDISSNGVDWNTLNTISVENSKEEKINNSNYAYTFESPIDYVETRYIRIKNNVSSRHTGETYNNNSAYSLMEVYFGYEPPNYRATIELYNANTLAKITTSVSANLLKNSVFNKTLTFATGSLLVENLDNTSTWSIETTSNSSYNALSPTKFTPTLNNPTVKLYLKPTVIKKFNFFDENGVGLSGKNVKLKIYKDGSTTAFIDTTVTTSTYTTTILYEGSYTYEIECEGYNDVEGTLDYDNLALNINLTLYVPINKTLILHDSEYKKWIPAIEEIPPSSTIPNMTAMVDKGFTIFSNDTAPRQPIHNLFSDSLGYFESGMSNTTVDKFIVGFLSDTPYLITKYEMKAHTTSMKTHFGNWILQGSNDTTTGFDGTWVDLDSQNGITWVANETKTFSINTPNSYKSYRLSEVNSPYGGYPMMYHLKFFKAGEPKKEGYWLNVSTTLPTKQHFLSEGMDSLSPLLDRRVETLEPLPMTERSDILSSGEVGKVFTRKIDLQKYIDLRKIEVEVR